MMWMNVDCLWEGKWAFLKKIFTYSKKVPVFSNNKLTHELEAPTEWEEKGFDYVTYNLFLVKQKLTLIKSVKIMCLRYINI